MLQYQQQVAEITTATGIQCPPQSAQVIQRDATRWVFNPITANCFEPVAIRNPPRLARAVSPQEECSCWALSMHDTVAASLTAFAYVEKSFRKAKKTLGTHVAVATINGVHGISTLSDPNGHFDLHPYVGGPFLTTFVINSAIP